MKTYLIQLDNQRVGPLQIEQVNKLVVSGHIKPNTLISVNDEPFVAAEGLNELNFKRLIPPPKKEAQKPSQTFYCPECSGVVSYHTIVCPHCQFDICAAGDERFREQEKERYRNNNVVAGYIDDTPGARELSKKLDLDFDVLSLNTAGWGLVACSLLTSLTIGFVVKLFIVPQGDLDGQSFGTLAFLTIISCILVFLLGRFVLRSFHIKIKNS